MNPLKQLRENRGLTPEELARAAGITVEWYNDLETHDDELDNNVSVRSVARIAGELGVSPSTVYGGTSGKAVSTHDPLCPLPAISSSARPPRPRPARTTSRRSTLARPVASAWPTGRPLSTLVRIENPSDHSPNTIDCVSCHLATPTEGLIAVPVFSLDDTTSALAFKPDGKSVVAADMARTFSASSIQLNIHAFSYVGQSPAINQRVVNETAAIVEYLNNLPK